MKISLSVENLSYVYKNKKEALKGVSFDVSEGEFTALLGPNGAGKSTFFNLACALIRPSNGHINLCGHELDGESKKALSQMGLVFQQSTLDLDLSVQQNLQYFASLHGISGSRANKRIQEELERLNLYERRHEKTRLLNGGHKRRVEIARSLLHDPKVLLLDEATVGLDVQTRKSIVDHVHSLCKERKVSVLWATHLIDEISKEDQVIILHQGRIVARDKALNLADPTLEETFQRLTQTGAS